MQRVGRGVETMSYGEESRQLEGLDLERKIYEDVINFLCLKGYQYLILVFNIQVLFYLHKAGILI